MKKQVQYIIQPSTNPIDAEDRFKQTPMMKILETCGFTLDVGDNMMQNLITNIHYMLKLALMILISTLLIV